MRLVLTQHSASIVGQLIVSHLRENIMIATDYVVLKSIQVELLDVARVSCVDVVLSLLVRWSSLIAAIGHSHFDVPLSFGSAADCLLDILTLGLLLGCNRHLNLCGHVLSVSLVGSVILAQVANVAVFGEVGH